MSRASWRKLCGWRGCINEPPKSRSDWSLCPRGHWRLHYARSVASAWTASGVPPRFRYRPMPGRTPTLGRCSTGRAGIGTALGLHVRGGPAPGESGPAPAPSDRPDATHERTAGRATDVPIRRQLSTALTSASATEESCLASAECDCLAGRRSSAGPRTPRGGVGGRERFRQWWRGPAGSRLPVSARRAPELAARHPGAVRDYGPHRVAAVDARGRPRRLTAAALPDVAWTRLDR